ncbi:hypothetical protein TNCV_832591 [Trichonephila clavipes]|nr:hypothetical protein TNCV_832591 [Trichonephila clavipes]
MEEFPYPINVRGNSTMRGNSGIVAAHTTWGKNRARGKRSEDTMECDETEKRHRISPTVAHPRSCVGKNIPTGQGHRVN